MDAQSPQLIDHLDLSKNITELEGGHKRAARLQGNRSGTGEGAIFGLGLGHKEQMTEKTWTKFDSLREVDMALAARCSVIRTCRVARTTSSS